MLETQKYLLELRDNVFLRFIFVDHENEPIEKSDFIDDDTIVEFLNTFAFLYKNNVDIKIGYTLCINDAHLVEVVEIWTYIKEDKIILEYSLK
jgi:hypothetical protein